MLGALEPAVAQALVFIIFVPDSRRSRVTVEVGRVELDFPEIGVIQDPLSVRGFSVDAKTQKPQLQVRSAAPERGCVNRSDVSVAQPPQGDRPRMSSQNASASPYSIISVSFRARLFSQKTLGESGRAANCTPSLRSQ